MTRPKQKIETRLARGPPLLLDGPTGTELERAGIDTSGPLWSTRAVREQPEALRAVHDTYVSAGADILTAVTFRGHRGAFAEAGLARDDWADTLQDAVRLARLAADAGPRPVWVAASQAPVADCYDPAAVPDKAILHTAHTEQAEVLAAARPDLILVETMNTAREAEIAVEAAAATGLPVWVSFIVSPGGRVISGEPLDEALGAVVSHVEAVLVNCASLAAVADAVPALQESGKPWGAYANGSARGPGEGWGGADVPPEVYAQAAGGWLAARARVIGSCCGTRSDHTRVLRDLIDDRR